MQDISPFFFALRQCIVHDSVRPKSNTLWYPCILYAIPLGCWSLVSRRFRCPDKKPQLISIFTLKTRRFRPLHKNQINADPSHSNEVILGNPHKDQINFILRWNQVEFDPPNWNQVNLETHTKCKSISMLTLKVILAPHSKTKWTSTTRPTTKSISSLH